MSRLTIAIIAAVLGITAAGALFFLYDNLSAPTVALAPATVSLSRPITVSVTGAVVSPGTYDLPADARLADLITAAGGTTADADPAGFNPAQRLTDAEQVSIPAIVPPTPTPAPTATPDPDAPQPTASATTGDDAPPSPGLIDINSADPATLDELPGIGPAIAQRIVDYRTEHGRFATVDELARVNGVSTAMVDKLRDLITAGE